MKRVIMLGMIIIFLISCSVNRYIVTESGDNVVVSLFSGIEIEGELISLSDKEAIILNQQEIKTTNLISSKVENLVAVDFDSIKHIEVSGYTGKGKRSALLFQILPAFIIGMTGAIYTGDMRGGLIFGAILALPGLISLMIYSATLPSPPQWNADLPLDEIKNLRIYARIPHEITEEQLNELLKQYHQEKIIEY